MTPTLTLEELIEQHNELTRKHIEELKKLGRTEKRMRFILYAALFIALFGPLLGALWNGI